METTLRGVIGCNALIWLPGDGGRLADNWREPRDGGVDGALVQFLAEIPGWNEMPSWSLESQLPGDRRSEPYTGE